MKTFVCLLVVAAFPAAFLLGLHLAGEVTTPLVVAAFGVPLLAPLVALAVLQLASAGLQLLVSLQQIGARR